MQAEDGLTLPQAPKGYEKEFPLSQVQVIEDLHKQKTEIFSDLGFCFNYLALPTRLNQTTIVRLFGITAYLFSAARLAW